MFCAAVVCIAHFPILCDVRSLPPVEPKTWLLSEAPQSSGPLCFWQSMCFDLASSQLRSMDRFTLDVPTSTPVMIEVSESLLSGGWCSPVGRERKAVQFLTGHCGDIQSY